VSRTLPHSLNLIMLVLVPTMLLCVLAPVFAVARYTPGVKPGDSVTYGQVRASWSSNIPPLSPVGDFLSVSSITVAVLNVVGNGVTGRETYNYPNGTTRTIVWVQDVQTGSGNMSSAIPWIIAGSLVARDPIYRSSSAESIAQTVQGVYAGSIRTVNIINSTQPEPGGFVKFLRIWDANTGILLGFALNYTVSNANYHVSASASTQISETSLWISRAPTRTTVPSLNFSIPVFIAAAIGSASVYVLHRRRGRSPPTNRLQGSKYRETNTSSG
jgi:hypothetical protein